jgi:ParB-like chromosome segregation protein Spo0J
MSNSDLKFNCDKVIYVPTELVEANDYNPNSVSPVNMDLLKTSIDVNGFCYPVIVIHDKDRNKYVIIDGYHRYKILKDRYKSEKIPVIVLDHDINKRMIATIEFNRAKGTHRIDGDANIVVTLTKNGMSDQEICKYLGMCLDEVLRMKQSTGLKDAFLNHTFSKSWDELKERLYK